LESETPHAGPNPLYALQLIDQLALYEMIFSPSPELLSPLPPDPSSIALKSGHLLSMLIPVPSDSGVQLDSVQTSAFIARRPRAPSLPLDLPPLPIPVHPSLTKHVEEDMGAWRHLWMAAFLRAYKGIKFKDKTQGEVESVGRVVLESLKVCIAHLGLEA
jgi:hypothetical protein